MIILFYFPTDNNIDLNWNKFVKSPPPKQIVLNKDVKAVKKSSTTIPLVGSNGVFLGYKDDYRQVFYFFTFTFFGGLMWLDFRTIEPLIWNPVALFV